MVSERPRRRRPALTVRGVIEHGGRYLFIEAADASSRTPGEPWYFLPGGHVEHGESMADALTRELEEETGIAVETVAPLFVREFIAPRHQRLSPQMPPDHHVIALIFLCRPRATEGGVEVRLPDRLDGSTIVRGARWLSPGELGDLDLRPPHLREALAAAPSDDARFLFWPEE